jgi:hypothetical protein
MSDESLSESPKYDVTVKVENLFIALARCPDCDQYPMIQIWEGGLLCPKCRKQYYEGPNHNFIRHTFEWTENVPNSFDKKFEEKIESAKTDKLNSSQCGLIFLFLNYTFLV